jgi:hypothetical protein
LFCEKSFWVNISIYRGGFMKRIIKGICLLGVALFFIPATAAISRAQSVVNFELSTQDVIETTGIALVSVNLSEPAESKVTVTFEIGGSALLDEDYSISPSPTESDQPYQVDIPAGTISADIIISVVDDMLHEYSETINLDIIDASNAEIGTTRSHITTIIDNDTEPVVQFTSDRQSVPENQGRFNIEVELSAPSGVDITLPFIISGTANVGEDYKIAASPIVLRAGEVRGAIAVSLFDDNLVEGNEDLIIILSSPVTNAYIGEVTEQTITILDNDGKKPSLRPRLDTLKPPIRH